MAYQPLEELLPRSGMSVYKLVRIASKRAQEISDTGAKLITMPSETKLTTVALEEIREGKVWEKDALEFWEEANAAKEKPSKK